MAAQQQSTFIMRLATLKRRQDFIAAARDRTSRKWVTPTLIVQCFPTPGLADLRAPEACAPPEVVQVGFTATKRLGNAVIRNRVRRRMKEAARHLLPRLARPGFAYVLIGRADTAQCPFQCLLDDLETALVKLHAKSKAPHQHNRKRTVSQRAEAPRRSSSNS